MPDWADELAEQIVKHPSVSNHDRLVKEISQALRDERNRAVAVAESATVAVNGTKWGSCREDIATKIKGE